MEIQIEKSKLKEMINDISDIIISNNYIYSLRGILIHVKKEEIKITGSSNNIFVIKKIKKMGNMKIIKEGKILIKSSLLNEIVNKVQNEIISLSTSEVNLLTIKDSNATFEITTIDTERYPKLVIDKTINSEFTISGKLFKKYLKTALASIDEYSSNQIYKSINISNENNKLSLSSTDSFRITKITTNTKIIGDLNQLLSIKTVREIIKIIDDKKELKIITSNKSIRIKTDEMIIQGKIINKLFQNISKIMQIENKYNLIISKTKLSKLIDIVTTISGTITSPIEMNINKNEIIIKLNEKELGKAEVKTNEIKFDGSESISIFLNSKYVNDVIKVLESENIIIRITDGFSPIWIIGENDLDQKHLLLPLRVS